MDDISLPAMLHAAVVRSPVAHGRLVRFEADVAQGVTVLGPGAFDDLHPQPILWRLGDQWQAETRVVDRHIRYVGQPLGLVVAASRYEAEDALDHLVVEIDEEPAVVDAFDALRPEAPLLYPERGTNRLAESCRTIGSKTLGGTAR